MNKFTAILAAGATAMALTACHSIESYDNDYYGNFDALWDVMDTHYCFFEEKGVDWNETGQRYRVRITPDMDYHEFFNLCAEMLNELRDGHTNLISWFDVSYYRNWWSDYPQNFNWRNIQQYYLDFEYSSGNSMSYKVLADGKAGYVHYASFSSPVSDSFVNEMMLALSDCTGMILDVRDNGGGELTNVERLVSHFITERIEAGYIQHKNGPGHKDFSEPYPFYYDPAQGVRWLKPVIILANRSTFSAANTFVAVMKNLPHVVVVGDVTGGGSGMPFSQELPIGWGVRFSACPLYDANMTLTENGVEPTDGGKLDISPEDEAAGRDTILDFAIDVLLRLDEQMQQNKNRSATELFLEYTVEKE